MDDKSTLIPSSLTPDEAAVTEMSTDEVLSAIQGDTQEMSEPLVTAVETPKYEHILCQSVCYDTLVGPEPGSMEDALDMADTQEVQYLVNTVDQLENGLEAIPESNDYNDDNDYNRPTQEEDAESGIEVTRDDSFDDFTELQRDSSGGESSVISSFKESSDKGSSQEQESYDVIDLEPRDLPNVVLQVSSQLIQTGEDFTKPAEHKAAKKEKGFFSSVFKRKNKNTKDSAKETAAKETAVKETAADAIEKKFAVLEKKLSRTSMFLFGSSNDLSSKPENRSVESLEARAAESSPEKDRVITPQEEMPSKGLFSLSGVLKRKGKKAESDVETLSSPTKEVTFVEDRQRLNSEENDDDVHTVKSDTDSMNEAMVDNFDADSSDNAMRNSLEHLDIDEEEEEVIHEHGDRGVDMEGYEGDDVSLSSYSTEYKSKRKMFSIPQYFKRMSKMSEVAKKMKTQIWSSVVTIVLIEGKKLLPMDDNGFSDPYVKFRLGNERYKSKVRHIT